MTRSQKILISSFTLFVAAFAVFQLCLLFGPAPWPLALDLVFGVTMGVLVTRAGFRFLGWFVPPLLVAFLCANPRALFSAGGEAHAWAMVTWIGLVVFGLLASGVGTLLGYLIRRFVTT